MKNRRAISRLTTCLMSATIFLSTLSFANAQLKQTGQPTTASQRVSIDRIDHTRFDLLLRKYVNRDGQVNYAAWKSSTTDRQQLQNYIAELSTASTTQSSRRENQLAYWINAYNAVTIEGILEVYPTSSIRNHTKKLGYNIWTDLKFLVDGRELSLEDIEHKILRKMSEPRIHFAIVCASVGCPRLLNEAYVGDRLDKQLKTNTTDFFSRKQNLQLQNGHLKLSAILKWFGSDFGKTQPQQIQYVMTYFPDGIRNELRQGEFRISFLDYDWDLNEQK